METAKVIIVFFSKVPTVVFAPLKFKSIGSPAEVE